MVVLAAMTVDTSELTCSNVGLSRCSRSTAMRFSAVLSSTTTLSAFSVSRFSASSALYGCTTTSELSVWFGNTEYVWISFFGNRSFSFSSKNDPSPDPVPPATEWHSEKPSSESLPSASRSIISISSSSRSSPWWYPEAQLFPAPPPPGAMNMFSGL